MVPTDRTDENTPKEKVPAKEKGSSEEKSRPKTRRRNGRQDGSQDGSKARKAKSRPSANYRRAQGQKPVTQAYKDNWNAILAKKKKEEQVGDSRRALHNGSPAAGLVRRRFREHQRGGRLRLSDGHCRRCRGPIRGFEKLAKSCGTHRAG